MIFRHEYRGGVWVDLEQPSEQEVLDIAKEFSIGEHIRKEILAPSPLPFTTGDSTATLLVMHFPAHGTEDGNSKSQEIDFIVHDRFIITVRYEVVAPLYHLKKLLDTQELVAGHDSVTTDVLLEILFAHLYTSVRDHTNHIAARLERVERDMFDGRERTTIRAIANVNREFLHIEASLANQEETLTRFLKALVDREFGNSFSERMHRILMEHTHVARLIRTYRAVATELRETNIALLESRQNEIMKTLTVVTFIFLPLELVTFVFGMHALGAPLEKNPDAFWIITGIMLAIGLLISLFVSRKKWLT